MNKIEVGTKKCPQCAEEIKLEAKLCRFCGARFMLGEVGYCQTCHRVVDLNADGNCATCGGEVADRHTVSELIQDAAPPPAPTPATPSAPQPFGQPRPAKGSALPPVQPRQVESPQASSSAIPPAVSKKRTAPGFLGFWQLYFLPNGRLGRKTFILEGLLPLVVLFSILIMITATAGKVAAFGLMALAQAGLVVLSWILLMLLVKRLQDQGISGWKTLYWLVPSAAVMLLDLLFRTLIQDYVWVLGGLSLLALLAFLAQLVRGIFKKGSEYANRYGPETDQLYDNRTDLSGAGIFTLKESLTRRRMAIGGVLAALILPLALFSLVRSFIDHNNLKQGLSAYGVADCAAASTRFDKLIHSWRLFDFGDLHAQASAKKEACQPFLAAEAKQGSGEYASALSAFTDLALSSATDPSLATAAGERIGRLFESQPPSALATLDTCPKLGDIQSAGLVPQPETRLPELYFACAGVYQSAGEEKEAYLLQKQLLIDYPQHDLTSEAEKALLANPAACDEVEALGKEPALTSRADFIPALYYGCGQVYDKKTLADKAFYLYQRILADYPAHTLAGKARQALLSNRTACEEIPSLQEIPTLAQGADFLPRLYYNCGQTYLTEDLASKAGEVFTQLFSDYPDHALASQAEQALLASEPVCTVISTLQGAPAIARRGDLLPSLYFHCAEAYESADNDKASAEMYQAFLDNYPDHARASEANAALARTLVAAARASGAGTISPPDKSGKAARGSTVVEITNGSPERLRLVFSGPESYIFELEACVDCIYYMITPIGCPTGPIGRFTLKPGTYEVLVESISDTDVTPYTGSWPLIDGDEYSSCFYIRRSFTFSPE